MNHPQHTAAWTIGDKHVMLGEHLNWNVGLPAEYVSDVGAGLEIHLARRDSRSLSAWADTLPGVEWTAAVVGDGKPDGFWMVSVRGLLGSMPVHVWATLDLAAADTADAAIAALAGETAVAGAS